MMDKLDNIRLNLGCGPNKMEGWINVDSVKEFQPDLLHDITSPLPYADLSVDAIQADGILEHFDKYMRFIIFCEWVRVLKIGGTIVLGVPDFKKILWRYFKFGFDKLVDTVFGETMYGANVYIGHLGSHKWGYSADSLKAFVSCFGIESEEVKSSGIILRLRGRKIRHVSQAEIDAIPIYSSANQQGIGNGIMTVKEARSKISMFHP